MGDLEFGVGRSFLESCPAPRLPPVCRPPAAHWPHVQLLFGPYLIRPGETIGLFCNPSEESHACVPRYKTSLKCCPLAD